MLAYFRKPVGTPTASIATEEIPTTLSTCHYHTDCSDHVCPSHKHPYCNIDKHSSTCQCTETTTRTTSVTTISLTTAAAATTTDGFQCPTCDEELNCVWNQTCYPEEICMIRQYPGTKFTTHCIRKEDCSFMKNVLSDAEIFCCSDRDCLRSYLGIN
ncbi:uncharacterized protein LOC133181654 [Saccostrea echinata]|uniref:uncharacterized protein LOC133181654 n=1 Tax=Saccostrea echinata TaxID=191078 RepID=UPI002A80A4F4|nr:uncharacterized protein LOC133181654 [Saccostrea echinata]